MQFTDHYEVVGTDDDWFDPILTVDMRLFVDPFRLFQDDDPRWTKAASKLTGNALRRAG